jgi:hypothetical protein
VKHVRTPISTGISRKFPKARGSWFYPTELDDKIRFFENKDSPMLNYTVCIFLSAFLLFQIQPIIAKILLPWFGGTPAVWSTAMLFFQIALTGGYAYANWLIKNIKAKNQTTIHLVLMGISVCLILYLGMAWPSPITPAVSWKPANINHPVPDIFLLLAISVGLPFFVLSTNSPLMQAWFSRKNPGRSPYWLYALSNIGSLLGLILYPIVIEPLLTLKWQGWIWTGGYLLFVIVAGYNAVLALRGSSAPVAAEKNLLENDRPGSTKGIQVLWILLSASASLLVLAVTSQITQEVAVIPFLWVLPLTIYLFSFVLAFSSQRWYQRGIFTFFLLFGTCAWFLVLLNPSTNFILQIVIYSFLLFAAVMICHGELYSLRPEASLLTRFYLMTSIGGAMGGLFVNLVAPSIFRGYWELYFGFAFVWILLAIVSYKRTGSRLGLRADVLVGAMAMAVSIFVGFYVFNLSKGDLFVQRNFYGVVRVGRLELGESQQGAYTLVHGSTIHGLQLLNADRRDTPTSYYGKNSGVGLAVLTNPHYGAGMRVGVLGLGVGTLAAYGQPGDQYRFYEINPVIVDLAYGQGGFFSFLKDSRASIEVVAGDARISLEKELEAGLRNDFDILVLDTFSSDSIPVHLVTREAFAIYLQHLAPDGLIAAHITNKRLDLRPIFWQLAQYYNLDIAILQDPAGEDNPATYPSTWVLLSRDARLLEVPGLVDRMDTYHTNIPLWTDDYSNLIQLLK